VQAKALLPLSAVLAAAAFVAVGAAAPPSGPQLTDVSTANTRAAGYAPASRLSAELRQIVLAQGSARLENPQGVITNYGYENDVSATNDPSVPAMLPVGSPAAEAQKTEPDKNTYLVFKQSLPGADASYDYGTHFLFQGHEGAATVNGAKQGYITRINLDADAAHRVTLLAWQDTDGHSLQTIDGSTWDPFAQRLLFTTENASAPTYAATPGYPSTVEDVSGALGRGGYEGIQDDGDGNIWIVEDIGGSNKPGTVSKIPNSFLYRYVPAHPGDLHNGKLQVLQVLNSSNQPITAASQTALNAPDQVALHAYGNSFSTRWVTVHDTAVDGHASFNANDAAKAKNGTPFKRPENGVFQPGSKFGDFYFTETGDTNATSVENPVGGWGSLFHLHQSRGSSSTGTISVFYKGDQVHTGLDNIGFLSRNLLGAVEDAGDTLHGQRNALDSAYAWDVTTDYSNAQNQPVRWLAEGRDASATMDAGDGGLGKNDGDNEITGLHISDGDPSVEGILGAKSPNLGDKKWRWFYTQQHGDNPTYEVLLNGRGHGDQGDDDDQGDDH
jgi:hypothetical protein